MPRKDDGFHALRQFVGVGHSILHQHEKDVVRLSDSLCGKCHSALKNQMDWEIFFAKVNRFAKPVTIVTAGPDDGLQWVHQFSGPGSLLGVQGRWAGAS